MMNKPYIICHMMSAVDGRIDCAMTEKLNGTKEYYSTLQELNTPTTLSGRVTAQLEMAEKGMFEPKNKEPFAKEGFSKKTNADGYSVVTDTKGCLLWANGSCDEKPLIIITSEQVAKEYLDYLDSKNISWIVCGKTKIDLAGAVKILAGEFGVKRMAVVGGGIINGAFLEAGLLDEISLLLGAGIDGRGGMGASFDGRTMDKSPIPLKLKNVTSYESGAVWLRYSI